MRHLLALAHNQGDHRSMTTTPGHDELAALLRPAIADPARFTTRLVALPGASGAEGIVSWGARACVAVIHSLSDDDFQRLLGDNRLFKITDAMEVAGGSGSSRRAHDDEPKIVMDGRPFNPRIIANLAAKVRDRYATEPGGGHSAANLLAGQVQRLLDRLTGAHRHLDRVDQALLAAGIEHPLGAAGVEDLAAQRDGALEELKTATDENKARDAWAAVLAEWHDIDPDPERDVYGAIALRLRSTVDERDQLREDVTRLGLDLASERRAVTHIKTQLVNEQARLRGSLAKLRARLADGLKARGFHIDSDRSVVLTTLGIVDELVTVRARLAGTLASRTNELATIRSAVPEQTVSDGLVDDVESLARRAAMLGPVLQWRDHTATMLDLLIKAATAVPLHTAPLLRIAAAAREVLQLDPEQAYGVQPVDQDDECEGAPTSREHAAACRFFAELRRLTTGLAELGIPLDGRGAVTNALHQLATRGAAETLRRAGERFRAELADRGITVEQDPIRAALDTIDRLTVSNDQLAQRSAHRHSELTALQEERLTVYRDLVKLMRTIEAPADRAAPKLATGPVRCYVNPVLANTPTLTDQSARPASTGEDAGLDSTVATRPTTVNGRQDGTW